MARPLSENHRLVLEAVRQAGKPVSAYDLLGKLHDRGLSAPPTIYRALRRLAGEGRVHRIESLNAYVACSEDYGHDHDHGAVAFAICGTCGCVTEFPCAEVLPLVDRWAAGAAFRVESLALELRGTCASCASTAVG